jgi:hypothetical protein
LLLLVSTHTVFAVQLAAPANLLLLLLLQNCGNSWAIWAGVGRGVGLPPPIVQVTGDQDPCMDAGCEWRGC